MRVPSAGATSASVLLSDLSVPVPQWMSFMEVLEISQTQAWPCLPALCSSMTSQLRTEQNRTRLRLRTTTLQTSEHYYTLQVQKLQITELFIAPKLPI